MEISIENIITGASEDITYVSERLRIIREELSEKESTTKKKNNEFSRSELAKTMDVSYQTLANSEKKGFSSIHLRLILLYYMQGYNPMWILNPENEYEPKMLTMGDIENKIDFKKQYFKLKKDINKVFNKFEDSL